MRMETGLFLSGTAPILFLVAMDPWKIGTTRPLSMSAVDLEFPNRLMAFGFVLPSWAFSRTSFWVF